MQPNLKRVSERVLSYEPEQDDENIPKPQKRVQEKVKSSIVVRKKNSTNTVVKKKKIFGNKK
ncbi:hypothetical protein ACG9Y7_04060 [Acinetobacter gerneri]|uniref:hypothetical protein n=1 Tax=Acinetobacter gerneri TaxID=202952 RepID=UPI003AF52E2F